MGSGWYHTYGYAHEGMPLIYQPTNQPDIYIGYLYECGQKPNRPCRVVVVPNGEHLTNLVSSSSRTTSSSPMGFQRYVRRPTWVLRGFSKMPGWLLHSSHSAPGITHGLFADWPSMSGRPPGLGGRAPAGAAVPGRSEEASRFG